MSEYDDDNFDGNDDEQGTPTGLRRAANKAKRLEQENAKLERELAFARAGITGTDQRTAIFMRGYDGELEPAAIRAVATEAGFIAEAPVSQQQDQQTQQAQAVQQQAQAITAPSAAAVRSDDPEARLEAAMAAGGVEAMFAEARNMGIPFTYDGQ